MSRSTARTDSTDTNPSARRAAPPRLAVAMAAVTCASMLVAAPAMAAKGSGGSGGGPSTSTSSLALVLLDSTDGMARHGQHVTFDVSTDATTQPYVSLTCKQGSTLVYSAVTGYFDGYPWPSTNTFTLSSSAWRSGAADCAATLYWYSGRKTITGATLAFPVAA